MLHVVLSPMPSARFFRVVDKRDVGIRVGIVDGQGTNIISYGKLDNGTDQAVNGDTAFEIGSITKTFTALLLQNMVI